MPLLADTKQGYGQSVQAIKQYGIFTLNAEGYIIAWNHGAEEVQGYGAEEVMGKPFAPLYGSQVNKPDDYFNELLAKACEVGYLEEEGWRQRKDGTYFWSTIGITPIYNNENRLIAYTVVSKDLTPKKLASELSEITEKASFGPVLATSNITWHRSPKGEFLYPVLQWENFTGQIWPEYKDLGWLKMHPEEEHEKILSFWHNLQGLDVSSINNNWSALDDPEIIKKLTLKTKLWSKLHNVYRHVVTSLVPIFNDSGELIYWVGNEKDEHKIMLEKNRYADLLEKQRLMLSSAKIGLWEYDVESERLDIDENVANFFGFELSAFDHTLAQRFNKMVPEDAERAWAEFNKCLTHGTPYQTEFRVFWPDGSIHHIVGSGTAHYNDLGKIVKLVGCNWDVTATNELSAVRTRAALAEHQREEQKKFVDTICHELRNPLNGITGHIDELEMVLSDLDKVSALSQEQLAATKDRLKNCIEVISECSKHQRQVINQVLDLSQIEKGKTILLKQAFSLQAACRALLAMHLAEVKAKGLNIELQLPEGEHWVVNDETRFKQIFINILSNAVHYTDKGGIAIKLDIIEKNIDKTKFTLSIIDSGPGFTEEQLANLFERFTSVTRYSFAKYKGTGLGLSISKELTELLGGSLVVESREGNGSTFRLSFEFENSEPPVSLPARSTALLLSKPVEQKVILVVDDNKTNRQILERLIKQMGFTCIHAEDGEQAVVVYQEAQPHLIFMDIEMPKKDGFAATASIRNLEKEIGSLRSIPIYAVTGYARDEYADRAKDAGMNGIVVKPFSAKVIKDIICEEFNLLLETPKEAIASNP